MNSSRKLAAIAFADISGYTALMQEDESVARQKLDHFRKDVDQIIPSFNGKVIQFYGDGCLMTFNSSIEAIKCAAQLQVSLKEEPNVPVRIGIHQGDIVIESGNVFGTAVNIAARIESMGIPGSILFSEKVHSEVRNQPDIEAQSLGAFEFKNVDHPVKVYVYANEGFPIPLKQEISGKFKSQSEERSIAVLPFENRSSDPEQEFMGDGIAEEIMFGLSKLDNLKVAGRASSFSFKNSSLSIPEIAAKLNVEAILGGSIRKMGNHVRISAQLTSASDGFQIWTERFDKELEDVFAIQDEIAERVIRKMEPKLMGQEKRQPIIQRKTEDIKAYQLYLQGKNYLDQRINIDTALTCFKQAIDLDQDFAAAYNSAAYAHVYQIILNNHHPQEEFPAAETAIQKALSLDSTNPESHTLRAWVDFYYHHKLDDAMRTFEKAVLLDPNRSDTYRIKGYIHSMMQHHDQAIEALEKAYELDPLSFNNCFSLAEIYFRANYVDKAIETFLSVKKKFPDTSQTDEVLGSIYWLQGDNDKAGAIFREKIEMPDSPNLYSQTRYLFALQDGNEKLTRAYLAHLEKLNANKWVHPTYLSLLHFYLGDNEKAESLFLQAINDRDPSLIQINIDFTLSDYINQPFVRDYYQKIGLSPQDFNPRS